jgi:hypothetical protein
MAQTARGDLTGSGHQEPEPVWITTMLNDPKRSLLERIAAVLSPAFKIIKVGFDFYVLYKTGH